MGTARSERGVEEPERPGVLGVVPPGRKRESITVEPHGRASEGVIVAEKRGNARGAKGPHRQDAESEE